MDNMNKHDRTAIIDIKVKADSGYQSDESHNISPDQWERISRILNEPVYVQQFGRGDREAPMQSHLTEWEVQKSIKDYLAVNFPGVIVRNIKVTDDGATYET